MGIAYILVAALVGSLIGWMTNVLAIKLIFRPYRAIKILGFNFQGLIPKRRNEIAKVIGKTVETDLLSSDEIVDRITEVDIQGKLSLEINKKVDEKVDELLPALIPSSFKVSLAKKIKTIISEELDLFFVDTFPLLANDLKNNLPIASMIEDKINDFSIEKLEEVVVGIAKKELKHIEYLGGILGFVIGLVQGLFFTILTF